MVHQHARGAMHPSRQAALDCHGFFLTEIEEPVDLDEPLEARRVRSSSMAATARGPRGTGRARSTSPVRPIADRVKRLHSLAESEYRVRYGQGLPRLDNMIMILISTGEKERDTQPGRFLTEKRNAGCGCIFEHVVEELKRKNRPAHHLVGAFGHGAMEMEDEDDQRKDPETYIRPRPGVTCSCMRKDRGWGRIRVTTLVGILDHITMGSTLVMQCCRINFEKMTNETRRAFAHTSVIFVCLPGGVYKRGKKADMYKLEIMKAFEEEATPYLALLRLQRRTRYEDIRFYVEIATDLLPQA